MSQRVFTQPDALQKLMAKNMKTIFPKTPSLGKMIQHILATNESVRDQQKYSPIVQHSLHAKYNTYPWFGVSLFTSMKANKQFGHCLVYADENPIQNLYKLNHEGLVKPSKRGDHEPYSVLKRYRPWDLAAVIYGFQSKLEAYEFEQALANPQNVGSKEFRSMMKELYSNTADQSAPNHILSKLHIIFYLLTDKESPFYRPIGSAEKSVLHLRLLSKEYEEMIKAYRFPVQHFLTSRNKVDPLSTVLVTMNTFPLPGDLPTKSEHAQKSVGDRPPQHRTLSTTTAPTPIIPPTTKVAKLEPSEPKVLTIPRIKVTSDGQFKLKKK